LAHLPTAVPILTQVVVYGEVLYFFVATDEMLQENSMMCMIRFYSGHSTNRFGQISFANLNPGSLEARHVDDLETMIGIHHEADRYYVVDRDSMIIPYSRASQ